jgi:hypothetical protein
MDRLLDVMSLVSIVLIASVLTSLRRAHIRVEYSVSWLGAGVLLLVLSLFRSLLPQLASWLGISYPPVALLVVVAGVFLFVFYRFSVVISALKDSNIALAQRVAILEFQIRNQPNHEERQA